MKDRITRRKQELEQVLSSEDYQKVCGLCSTTAEHTFRRTRALHQEKLEKLTKKKADSLRPEGTSRWVINRTDKQLSSVQTEVLALGLNFTPAPSTLPLNNFASAIESGACELDRDLANDLKVRVCGLLRKAKLPKSNLTKVQRSALKDLRATDDVIILPADKGNTTVVMSKEEYDRKIITLLDTPTYKRLPRDPTASQESKISRTLLKIRKDKKLPLRVYDKLRPSGSQLPRIYGLPKIPKPDVPLRPIVSCINSPTYRLSQHISALISPLAGHTETAVKNSAAKRRVTQDELLVSFDVSSLFTNVPVPEAVEVIREMLRRDPKLSERTTLDADTIADLLSLCLKSTYFRYNSCYYEQKEGAAMGSPVSAVVANLYMEHFEQIALNSAL